MLTELLTFSRREITVERDARRYRRSDLPVLVGNSSRLRAKLGWAPRRALHETLMDVLEDCRTRLRAARRALTDRAFSSVLLMLSCRDGAPRTRRRHKVGEGQGSGACRVNPA